MNSICLESADQDICVLHPPVVIPRKAGAGVGDRVDVGDGEGLGIGIFVANEGSLLAEDEGLSPWMVTTATVWLGGGGGTLVAVVRSGVGTRRVGTGVAGGPSLSRSIWGARITKPFGLLGDSESSGLIFADSVWGLQLVATAANSRTQSQVA